MSTGEEGKVTVSLKEAVDLVKRNRAEVPTYVKAFSEQNRAIREARRTLPTVPSKKTSA